MRSCWVSARSRALSALSRSPFNWLDIFWTCRVRSASWPATLAMSSLAVMSAGFYAASGTARCSRKSLRQPRQHHEVSMESDPLKPTDAKWCQPALGRRTHRCAQRAPITAAPSLFPANRQLPGNHDGATMPIVDPSGRHPSAASWWARAMAPLWQYFSRLRRRQTSSLLPQRAWTPEPCGFSPAN
jgi:hypothetical protein